MLLSKTDCELFEFLSARLVIDSGESVFNELLDRHRNLPTKPNNLPQFPDQHLSEVFVAEMDWRGVECLRKVVQQRLESVGQIESEVLQQQHSKEAKNRLVEHGVFVGSCGDRLFEEIFSLLASELLPVVPRNCEIEASSWQVGAKGDEFEALGDGSIGFLGNFLAPTRVYL